jgi:sec-independent protein translocase protein TatB
MFDVGFSEMLMVGLVALLVLGPERLPKVAKEAALWLRKVRSLLNTAKADIKRELDLEELKELRAMKESLQLAHHTPRSILESTLAQPEPAATQEKPAPVPTGEVNV